MYNTVKSSLLVALFTIFFFIHNSYAGTIGIRQSTDAKSIQMALKETGLYKGSVDGKIGPKTKQAIEEFQKKNGLKSDGIVGKHTRGRLNRYIKKESASHVSKKTIIPDKKNDVQIAQPNHEFVKLQEEKRFYQKQVEFLKSESSANVKQIQELSRQLYAQNEEKQRYLMELVQKERSLTGLRLDYEDRLKAMNKDVGELIRRQNILLVEKRRMELAQAYKAEGLIKVKKDLDAIIDFYN